MLAITGNRGSSNTNHFESVTFLIREIDLYFATNLTQRSYLTYAASFRHWGICTCQGMIHRWQPYCLMKLNGEKLQKKLLTLTQTFQLMYLELKSIRNIFFTWSHWKWRDLTLNWSAYRSPWHPDWHFKVRASLKNSLELHHSTRQKRALRSVPCAPWGRKKSFGTRNLSEYYWTYCHESFVGM